MLTYLFLKKEKKKVYMSIFLNFTFIIIYLVKSLGLITRTQEWEKLNNITSLILKSNN